MKGAGNGPEAGGDLVNAQQGRKRAESAVLKGGVGAGRDQGVRRKQGETGSQNLTKTMKWTLSSDHTRYSEGLMY